MEELNRAANICISMRCMRHLGYCEAGMFLHVVCLTETICPHKEDAQCSYLPSLGTS